MSRAQEFSDKKFDTVILKRYKMYSWIPKFYQPVDLIFKAF